MIIGITSQNFRTITGHAGKTRRFLVYAVANGGVTPMERIDLPKDMSMHEFAGTGPHPLDRLDVLITQSCGPGFLNKMAARGVAVVQTSESDPATAIETLLAAGPDALPPPEAHLH